MLGVIFALLSAVLFAANYVLVQMGMKYAKDNGVYLNILINVVVLSLLYAIVFIFRQEVIDWQATGFFAFIMAGILTTLLGRSTLFSAIRQIGSSRAAAIKNAAPIFTILGAVLVLDESIHPVAGLGIFMVMLGIYLVAQDQWKENGVSKDKKFALGLLLASSSALFFGMGQVARKVGLLSIADPILGSLVGSFVAFIVFSLTLMVRGVFKETLITQIKHANRYYIMAGLATSLGLLSFFTSAQLTKVSYTSAVAATEPVMTVILAYFFLKKQENLKRSVVISVLLVFTGIVIISLSSLM